MKLAAILMLLFALFAFGACGGGGDDDAPGPGGSNGDDDDGDDDDDNDDNGPGETGTEADLIAAAEAAFQAVLDGEDQAYFLALSEECREEFGFASVETRLIQRRTNASTLGGIDLNAVSVADVVVENFDGGSADVSLVIEGTGEAEFQEALPRPWIAEDGGWRMDDCSDIRPGQGGIGGIGQDRDDPLPFGGVTDAEGWFVAVVFIDDDSEDLVIESGGTAAGSGNQYFLAQLLIGYNGAEPSIAIGDELEFAMVSGDTVYGDDAVCDVIGGYDPAQEFQPGVNAAPPSLCREIDSGDADGLLLRMTHLPTGDEYWFALEQ